jgi:hypothetical protein
LHFGKAQNLVSVNTLRPLTDEKPGNRNVATLKGIMLAGQRSEDYREGNRRTNVTTVCRLGRIWDERLSTVLVDGVDGVLDSCDLMSGVIDHASTAVANEQVNFQFVLCPARPIAPCHMFPGVSRELMRY